jgi:uncharacterized protein YndB with AHSA1/START domain
MNYEPFVLKRTFKAPRTLVWVAFSQAEHLGHWMSPKGLSPGRNFMDFRPGGIFHYEIVPPGQTGFWGRWIFRDIVDQELIITHASFSDEGGGITRHPMAPEWPLEMLSKTRFFEVEGGTKIEMQTSAVGSDPIQLKSFDEGKSSMTQAWGGTFEILDAHLHQLQRR